MAYDVAWHFGIGMKEGEAGGWQGMSGVRTGDCNGMVATMRTCIKQRSWQRSLWQWRWQGLEKR